MSYSVVYEVVGIDEDGQTYERFGLFKNQEDAEKVQKYLQRSVSKLSKDRVTIKHSKVFDQAY